MYVAVIVELGKQSHIQYTADGHTAAFDLIKHSQNKEDRCILVETSARFSVRF